MYSSIQTILPIGSLTEPLKVEAQVLSGLPSFRVVGLSGKVAKETAERVYSAIKSSSYKFPSKKVRVSISPNELPKNSGGLDLPIALSILIAAGAMPSARTQIAAFGNLSLNGELTACFGYAHFKEFTLSDGFHDLECTTLKEVCDYYIRNSEKKLALYPFTPVQTSRSPSNTNDAHLAINPYIARLATVIMGGRHNVLIRGPYGIGKSKLLQIINLVQPLPSEEECEQLQKVAWHTTEPNYPFIQIQSLTNITDLRGASNKPGSGLLHKADLGVLAVDEMNLVNPRILSLLQECLDDRYHEIHIQSHTYRIPTRIQLVGTMNLCRCGLRGSEKGVCTCSQAEIERFNKRMTQRFISRFDIRLNLSSDLIIPGEDENIAPENIRAEIERLWSMQKSRIGIYNSQLSLDQLVAVGFCKESLDVLNKLEDRAGLSLRDRLMIARVARTIADIEREAEIGEQHILEAASYR